MSPPDESLRDLAAAYALGALSPEETRAFEAYLATSPDAQREVVELRETAALLAVAGPEARPGPELRQRLLDAVAARKVAVMPKAARPVLPWLAAAAAVLVAVGLGVRLQTVSVRLATRDSTIADQRRALSEQQQQLVKNEATLAALLAPGVQLVQLTKKGDPDPRIQLYWDRVHNTAVLHASKLEPTPRGRTYQLWFIRDGKPVPSVTFDVAPAGDALLREVTVPSGGTLTAAAITQEPTGGSQQPTSPILLVGPLKS